MPLGILTIVVLAVTWHHHGDRIRRHGAAGAFILAPRPHLQLGAPQAVGVPDREDHGHGVLAVHRLRALSGVLRLPAASSWSKLRAVDELVADPVHDPVAGDHLRPRMAAEWTDDVSCRSCHCSHFNIDLILWARWCSSTCRRFSVAAGGDVGVLPKGRGAETVRSIRSRGMMPYMIIVVCMVITALARHDAVAAELPLRRRLIRA
jgi:hypothetical protein